MELDLIKVHGSENSFFILDETILERPLTEAEIMKVTTTLTNRETGLLNGADGILLITKSSQPEAVAKNACNQ